MIRGNRIWLDRISTSYGTQPLVNTHNTSQAIKGIMNILQVGTGAIKIPPEKYGGTEFLVYRVSKHIAGEGHNITIADIKESKADPDIEYIDGIKFVRLHTRKSGITFHNLMTSFISTRINTVFFALRVMSYIRKSGFDVIQIYGNLIGLILIFLNRKLRGKIVYYCNNPAWFMTSPGRLQRLALTLDHGLIRQVNKVIVETDLLKEKLLARGKVAQNKIIVVPPGVETSEFKPGINPREAIEKYGLEGRTVILFVGRIVPYKGVEYLVKAADLVVNDFGYKDALFLIVGPLAEHELDKVEHADYISRIFSFIKNRHLESHVKFTGVLPTVELPGMYSACDIFVLPSLAETFGQVISQAMSTQKPVIGTRIPGIVAQIKDGWNGYLVEPADEHQLAEKIKHLIDNPREREKMGINSRQFAEDNLDWSRTSQMILQLYQSTGDSG